MRLSQLPSPLFRIAASMVHDDVRGDPIRAAFHTRFIATRLIGGLAAVLALPVYLAVWGAPSLLAAIGFGWLAAPLATALYLSRTGRLAVAHLLSAATLAGLVTFVAAFTGGMASPFLPWLIAVPAEAALSGSARIVLMAMAIAAASLFGLGVGEAAGLLTAVTATAFPVWTLGLLGTLPTLVYVGVLMAQAGGLSLRLAQGEQAESARLHRLIGAAGDLIVIARRNGNVTFATAADPGADALGGGGLFNRVHVADRPAYLKALDDAAQGETACAEIRVAAMGEGDGFGWVEMRCRPLAPSGPGSPDIVAVINRIGSRKQTEGALRSAREQAERASIAKGRFLASMSHELRTPLNAIIGFSEILKGTAAAQPDTSEERSVMTLAPEKQHEYAALIHESGLHLLEVVNDVLDMSKIETGKFEIFPEPFEASELIRSCCKLVGAQAAEAGLRIETDLPHTPFEIHADRRACKQILLNLLSNAIKFSEPDGRIVAGTYPDGSGSAFYVADEGIGITKTDIARLGAPFVQLNDSYSRRHQGTGLGLSVVKGLVGLHGGEMEIESEVGRGTRITIHLPHCPATPETGDTAIAAGAMDETVALPTANKAMAPGVDPMADLGANRLGPVRMSA